MGKFLDSLKPDYAVPTLRGLVVEADSADGTLSAGELFSWLDVEWCHSSDGNRWRVNGPDGRTLRPHNKYLVLQIRDMRSNRIAFRARDRALRACLDDPAFKFRCRLPKNRLGSWFVMFFGAAYLAIGAIAVFHFHSSIDSIADAKAPELEGVNVLNWIVLAGLVLLFVILPIAVVIFGIRQLQTRFVRSVSISGTGISCVLDDSSRFSQPWSNLEGVAGRTVLFHDGSRVDFGPSSRRVWPWLFAVRRRVFGLNKRPVKNQLKPMTVRLSVAVLLIIALSGFAFRRTSPFLVRPEAWMTLWLLFSAVQVLFVAGLWFAPLVGVLHDYIERRQRRQGRQRRVAASRAH